MQFKYKNPIGAILWQLLLGSAQIWIKILITINFRAMCSDVSKQHMVSVDFLLPLFGRKK